MKENFNYLIIFWVSLVSLVIFWGGYFLFYHWHYFPVGEKKVILKLVLDQSGKDKQIFAKIDKDSKKKLEKLIAKIDEQKNTIKKFTNSQYLTVSNLNAFYSSLFTAIAVIVGIIGLIGWSNYKKIIARSSEVENNIIELKKEVNQKLNLLEDIEGKVKFLHHKKDYADWIKNLFNKDNDLTSSQLGLKPEGEKKLNEIKDYIKTDITNNSWLEMLLAKKMNDEGKYDEAIKIIDFIELRDLLDKNIKPYLFHFKAQFLWNKYLNKKNILKNKCCNILEDAKKYYEESLKENDSRDETHGNLAVVLIELAEKHYSSDEEKEKILESAIEHLNKVIELGKSTYNTYYDLARATYLLNENKLTEDTKDFLFKAAEYIESKKSRKVFFSYLDEEENIFNKAPDWSNIKQEIKNKVDQKKWLK